MNSKGWKLLVVAPLALTLLSACGSRNRKDNNDTSRFTGTWMREEAYADFSATRGDAGAFCATIQQSKRFAYHGYAQGRDIDLQVLRVSPAGDVSNWTPGVQNPQVAQRYVLGRLNGGGTFNPPPRYNPGRDSYVNELAVRNAWTRNTTFIRDSADHMTMFGPNSTGAQVQRGYVRVSESEVVEYTRVLTFCTHANIADPLLMMGGFEQGLDPRAIPAPPPPAAGFAGPGPVGPEAYDDGAVDSRLQIQQAPPITNRRGQVQK